MTDISVPTLQGENFTAIEVGAFVDLDPGYHRTGIPLDETARIAAVRGLDSRVREGVEPPDSRSQQPADDCWWITVTQRCARNRLL